MSGGWGRGLGGSLHSEVPCRGGGEYLYGEVQCIMDNGTMGHRVDRQIDPTETITFVGGW